MNSFAHLKLALLAADQEGKHDLAASICLILTSQCPDSPEGLEREQALALNQVCQAHFGPVLPPEAPVN